MPGSRRAGEMDELTQPWRLPVKNGCHCLCHRWGHRGLCTGEAQTWAVMESSVTGVTWIPLCGPCAEDIDRQQRGGEAV